MNGSKPIIGFKIEIIVEPDDGGFHGYCPVLQGLHVSGDTEEEAVQNAKDAAIAYLESLIKHGDSIPIGVIVKRKGENVLYPHSNRASHHTEDLKVACAI
ncbi:MAG: type II toxin-antitoxin system HicB family antitoxin [Chloroflexi bacterium]|nr:type II toxin-antitoxin system HicB family antitoxin [Chloroflexota bacterium]